MAQEATAEISLTVLDYDLAKRYIDDKALITVPAKAEITCRCRPGAETRTTNSTTTHQLFNAGAQELFQSVRRGYLLEVLDHGNGYRNHMIG